MGQHKKEFFNGKIGIWPFVKREAVKRRSANRNAGTIVTKAISSVTKEETRKMFIEKLLPAIKEKFPESTSSIMIKFFKLRAHNNTTRQRQTPSFGNR